LGKIARDGEDCSRQTDRYKAAPKGNKKTRKSRVEFGSVIAVVVMVGTVRQDGN